MIQVWQAVVGMKVITYVFTYQGADVWLQERYDCARYDYGRDITTETKNREVHEIEKLGFKRLTETQIELAKQ
jgi:hypothetical protein